MTTNESNAHIHPQPKSSLVLGLVGLTLVVVGPFVYVLLLDVPIMRSTGLPAFLLMGLGVCLSAWAVLRDGRKKIKGMLAANVVLTLTFAYAMFGYAQLPSGRGIVVGQIAPSFALSDSQGRTVELLDQATRGPTLLVFYRGYW